MTDTLATPTPADPPVRTVALRRGRLAYTDEPGPEGAPTLVALHGLPGNHRDYRYLAGAVAGRARVVRLEMPGWGDSDLGLAKRHDPSGWGAVVAEAVEALGLRGATLVGHSIGGVVALHAARTLGDGVGRLALLASPGLRPHVMLRRLRPRLVSAMTRTPGVRQAMMPALRKGYRRAGFSPSLTDRARVDAIRFVARVDFRVQKAAVAAVRAPTLVAWSADDRIIEDAVSEELAAALPHGPRLRYESGGHNIQKTRAAELGEALLGFHDPHLQT